MVYDELDMLQRLKHPHIVKFVDWFESRVRIFPAPAPLLQPADAPRLPRTSTTSSPSWPPVVSCSTGSVNRASSPRRTPRRPSVRSSRPSTTSTRTTSSTEARPPPIPPMSTTPADPSRDRPQAREPPLHQPRHRIRPRPRRFRHCQDA
jgi:hypothetical protein